MTKIVITGGIACGKTLFCAYLSEQGFDILDCDFVVHALESRGGAAVEPIRREFGDAVIQEDGAVDRKLLGELVFADEPSRKLLNFIVHPLVERHIEQWFKGSHRGIPLVVIPLLYELGWEDRYECVVALVAEHAERIRRLVSRRGFTVDEAEARISAQIPAVEQSRRADITVENNGSVEALKMEAERVGSLLKKRYG